MPDTPRPADVPDELIVADAALRDQMADALTTERWGSKHDLGEHGRHSFYAPCGICQGDVGAIIRLVMPVVAAALTAARDETARERQHELAEADEYDLDTDPDALRRNLNEVITFLDGRGPKLTQDAVWARVRPVLRIHREKLAEQRQRAEKAEAAIQRARSLADEALPAWKEEHAYHQERAERKGYSHDEAAAEAYGRAIEVLSQILAALDRPADPPPKEAR